MISIIVASVLAFIFGAVWYMSPVGIAWRNAKLHDESSKKYMNNSYMVKMFSMGFAITVVLAYVLDVFFQISGVETLGEHMQLSMLICFGFIITTKFSDLIYTNTAPFWGRRAQTIFLVDAGFYIGTIAIMTAVLYWL
jgi:hypothetical protein